MWPKTQENFQAWLAVHRQDAGRLFLEPTPNPSECQSAEEWYALLDARLDAWAAFLNLQDNPTTPLPYPPAVIEEARKRFVYLNRLSKTFAKVYYLDDRDYCERRGLKLPTLVRARRHW